MSGQVRQGFYRGLGPSLFQGPGTPSAGAVAYPIEIYSTPILDLTKIVSGIEAIPARPGYIATQFNSRWIVQQLSGTQTSPPTYQMGSDPAHQNFVPSTAAPSNASVNAIVGTPALGNGGLLQTGLQFFPNAPVFFDVTAAAQGTGGFALLARHVSVVWWIAVGGGF